IYATKFDDVIDKLDILNQENERFLLWWLVGPIGPKDNVLIRTINPPGTPPGILGQAATPPGGGGNTSGLPMDTNDLLSLILKLFPAPSKPFHKILQLTGRYDQMLTVPLLPVPHRECEYAIPVASAPDVLKALRRIIEEGDISTTLPIEVRFVASDT